MEQVVVYSLGTLCILLAMLLLLRLWHSVFPRHKRVVARSGVTSAQPVVAAVVAPPRPQLAAQAPPADAVLERLLAESVEQPASDIASEQSSKERVCPQCGALNRSEANHCGKCGFTFTLAVPPAPSLPIAHLQDDQGHAITLGKRTTIGSDAHNTLVLNHPSVSAVHAEIVAQDGSYILIDRGSTNGSFVDNQRAFRNRLRPGVRLRFGQVEWLFKGEEGYDAGR